MALALDDLGMAEGQPSDFGTSPARTQAGVGTAGVSAARRRINSQANLATGLWRVFPNFAANMH
ncbi:MAG: hypothetical protein IIA73_03660 [Proteobacteria bacterium]|nr:hypothetical protein [Pseudomonadota bacterium]